MQQSEYTAGMKKCAHSEQQIHRTGTAEQEEERSNSRVLEIKLRS